MRVILDRECICDPLDSISRSLIRLFQLFFQYREAWDVLQILTRRCEYNTEFSDIPIENYLFPDFVWLKIESAYCAASKIGVLRSDIVPTLAAFDTKAFAVGLIYSLLNADRDGAALDNICKLIHAHVSLRKIVQ